MLRTCEKLYGVLVWFKWVGVLGWLGLAYPTACACLFKVRACVLSKTLSHMWGKLNLPIFLFNVGLFTLINIDSLVFLARQVVPSQGGMQVVQALNPRLATFLPRYLVIVLPRQASQTPPKPPGIIAPKRREYTGRLQT